MVGFVCWDPMNEDEPGPEPERRNIIQGVVNAEGAAEVYAERCLEDGDPFDEISIEVRDPDGRTHTVKVTVDYSPVFYAEEQS